jgi:hypothetical protein
MKSLTKRLTEVFAVALLLTTCVVSAGQLSVKAAETPWCHLLECNSQPDCGSKCFCNTPSRTCYDDSAEQVTAQ